MNEQELAKDVLTQDAMQKRYQAEYERYKAWFLERRQRVLDEVTAHRQPGILDHIRLCESFEAAHLMWHEFLDSANEVSQKTINRATKLLATLDFPRP